MRKALTTSLFLYAAAAATSAHAATLAPVLFAEGKLDLAVSTLPEDKVCTGVTFYDPSGSVRSGTMNCGLPGNCTATGQTGCTTTATFVSADLSNLTAANIRAGTSVAGIGGSYTAPVLNACTSDGQVACRISTGYKAVTTALATAANIKAGVTLAGTSGAYPSGTNRLSTSTATNDLTTLAASISSGSYEWFDSDGTRYTGTVADAGAITPSTTTQSFNAAVYRQFSIAAEPNLAANYIKSGVTLFGITGQYPSATYPLPGASGVTDLATLSAATTAGMYEWWGLDGQRYSGSVTDPGTIAPGATSQTFNASVYTPFTVAGAATLTAANIKSGVSIFIVTGSYPSVSYPLANDTGLTDLTSANFNTSIQSAGTFEWFDAAGNVYSRAGDSNLTAANILSGQTIFGNSGSRTYSSCGSDGTTACTTTPTYKAMDTDSSVVSSYDVRRGKTLGGVVGTLTFLKNMAGSFNRTTGSGALAGYDPYDTVEDNNNGGAFPSNLPSGFVTASSSYWLRDSVSDTSDSNGTCNNGEDCVYVDRITGAYWSKDDATLRDWETAITFCDDLTLGTYSDWRLPTHKELVQASIDGIWSIHSTSFNLSALDYWAATTDSTATTYAYKVSLRDLYATSAAKTATNRVSCVRP